ncbi:MAG: outer membrane lipoprotein carrier protein LolA [Ignavibacteriae bacterium]|nr:outer membrane lipoprotein carrier protein LolA [Ignavibacteriota bacterium]
MRLRKIIVVRQIIEVLVLGVAFFGSGMAQPAQDILEKMKQKYDTIKDAELKFTQRTKFEMSGNEQSVSGTLLIKKGNKYRVELENSTVVTDGVTVWSYSVPNKQVVIDKFKLEEKALTPLRIITAAPKDYYATVLKAEKIGKTETQLLKLVPKDSESMIRTMKIWIDESTWLMKKVEIVDVNGNETVYTVLSVNVNPGLADSRFAYQIPKGVEAVDLR